MLIILHVIVCILLVAIVLLQVGRGRGMLGFLGGGAAESLFGSRAGDVLTKGTTAVAILFMVTSLSLAYLSVKKGTTIMKGIGRRAVTGEVGEQPAGESPLVQKGAGVLDNLKDKIAKKIPKLVKGEEGAEVAAPEQPAGEMQPSTTTKSKFTYDAKGNKIEDALVYDKEGKLVGHKQITYDRMGKKIDEQDLPLEEKPVEKPAEKTLVETP